MPNQPKRVIAASIAALLALGANALAQAPAPAAPTPTTPSAAPQTSAAELEFWSSVKDSKKPAELKAYLATYPNGAFAALAKVRLQALEVTPPPAPVSTAAPAAPPAAPRLSPTQPAAATTPPVAANSGGSALSTPEIVREVQNKLYNLNYTVPTNGRHDAETRTAIRRWQVVTKRPETGDITGQELAILRAAIAPNVWAAIGYNTAGGASSHWNINARARAEELALAGCKKMNGGNCQTITVAVRGCLAVSYTSGVVGSTRYNNAFGVARPTLAEATDVALTECRAKSKVPNNCGVRTTACADGGHKK